MKRALLIFAITIACHGQTFSPVAGTYTSPQTVSITPPSGKTCFYTLDGTPASNASTLYVSPITVSTSKTINVSCVQTGVVYQNTEASSSHWKCVTASGGTFGSLTCQSGGGVGSNNPSNVIWTFGEPMVETLSTTASSGETQALFINTQSSTGCTDCTQLTEEKTVQPNQGPSFIANHEMDSNVNMLATYNQFHTASLQCNQQSGINQWQYDNQQGSWKDFSPAFRFGCPLSTTQPTKVTWSMHWTNGDSSCTGGYSTDHYDTLQVCVGGTCQTATGGTLCGYSEPTWSQSMVIQDQPDLTNTVTCGTSPCTASRSVWNNNMTLSYFGTTVTANATYTITGSGGPTKIGGVSKLAGRVVIQ